MARHRGSSIQAAVIQIIALVFLGLAFLQSFVAWQCGWPCSWWPESQCSWSVAWLVQHRRLVRDYERTDTSAPAWIFVAMIRVMLRRLA